AHRARGARRVQGAGDIELAGKRSADVDGKLSQAGNRGQRKLSRAQVQLRRAVPADDASAFEAAAAGARQAQLADRGAALGQSRGQLGVAIRIAADGEVVRPQGGVTGRVIERARRLDVHGGATFECERAGGSEKREIEIGKLERRIAFLVGE